MFFEFSFLVWVRFFLFCMVDKFFNDSNISFNSLSWNKAYTNLFRVQFRLFKSVLVGNRLLAFSFQNLLLRSNSLFLISVREITQIDIFRRIPGIDSKIYLDFSERFELMQFLKKNFFNWLPQKLKKVLIIKKDGSSLVINISSISDRCWYTVIKYVLSPAHEASFSYRNFGFRLYNNVFELQRLILLNMNDIKNFVQKRLLFFDFQPCFVRFNHGFLLNKLFISRAIKLIIFRFFKFGFLPGFFSNLSCLTFNSVLANILLGEIDDFHSSVRYGYDSLFFLKPLDDEKVILKRVNDFLAKAGMYINFTSKLLIPYKDFNFLNWNFSVTSRFDVICIPTFHSYQFFLRRVKRIINNSNFGAKIKCLKLGPIIQDWYFYNRFTNLEYLKYSLYFIKKRTFKIFNSEVNQDRYSSKVLINKCFSFTQINAKTPRKGDFFTTFHMSFWFDYSSFLEYSNSFKVFFKKDFKCCLCIHCGSRMIIKKFNY